MSGPALTELRVEELAIHGLRQLTCKAVADERGTVRELFRISDFHAAGLPVPSQWKQMNLTWTKRGAVRGLHGEQMTKLVGLAAGQALGAYVDARTGSPTRGAVVTAMLTPGVQLLVPAGVLNGFQALSTPGCEYLYCFDSEWQPGMAGVAVNPLDPQLGIKWPIPIDPTDAAQISAKDAAAPPFVQL